VVGQAIEKLAVMGPYFKKCEFKVVGGLGVGGGSGIGSMSRQNL
jgi:hypothetical protein